MSIAAPNPERSYPETSLPEPRLRHLIAPDGRAPSMMTHAAYLKVFDDNTRAQFVEIGPSADPAPKIIDFAKYLSMGYGSCEPHRTLDVDSVPAPTSTAQELIDTRGHLVAKMTGILKEGGYSLDESVDPSERAVIFRGEGSVAGLGRAVIAILQTVAQFRGERAELPSLKVKERHFSYVPEEWFDYRDDDPDFTRQALELVHGGVATRVCTSYFMVQEETRPRLVQ